VLDVVEARERAIRGLEGERARGREAERVAQCRADRAAVSHRDDVAPGMAPVPALDGAGDARRHFGEALAPGRTELGRRQPHAVIGAVLREHLGAVAALPLAEMLL